MKIENIRDAAILLDLVPRTEPMTAAAMTITANKLSGIMNLFFRYQERLARAKKFYTEFTIRKGCDKTHLTFG